MSGVLIVPQSLGETRLSLENTWESKLIPLIHISVTRFACPFSYLSKIDDLIGKVKGLVMRNLFLWLPPKKKASQSHEYDRQCLSSGGD